MQTEQATKHEKLHEPMMHIIKRGTLSTAGAIWIRSGAIALALIFCGIIMAVTTGQNPFSIYVTIFEGAFKNSIRVMQTLHELALLLGVSLAVTPAFKMKFWNTGAEGQVLIGALATALCMFYIPASVPEPLLILFMVLTSVAAGALWGFLPAVFKALWGTNETLFTLMMNYVAMQLIKFFLGIMDKSGSNTVGPGLLFRGHLPPLFDTEYLLNIVIVAVLTVLVYIYLKYTKQGYEISVVGESEKTALYVGINVKKVIIRTMIISGAICGVVGLLIVGGASYSIDPDIARGRGFTAIMVSWLSKFNPFIMVATSALLTVLSRGAEAVSTKFGLNSSFSDIITAIILFFIIGCEFFVQYKVVLNANHPVVQRLCSCFASVKQWVTGLFGKNKKGEGE